MNETARVTDIATVVASLASVRPSVSHTIAAGVPVRPRTC